MVGERICDRPTAGSVSDAARRLADAASFTTAVLPPVHRPSALWIAKRANIAQLRFALSLGIEPQPQKFRVGETESTAGSSSVASSRRRWVTEMSDMVKPPFSVRQDPDKLEAFCVLQEGLPDSLMPSLFVWISEQFFYSGKGGTYPRRNGIDRLERVLGEVLPHRRQELMSRLVQDHELLLNALDSALATRRYGTAVEELTTMLDEARSVYTVGVDENGEYELQFRQPIELTELVEAATSGTDSASHHLRQAWSLAFGREPEPTAACDEAVRAIEAAAKPVVTPSDSQATLGKMIPAMRDAPHKWTTDSNASDDIDTAIAMMDLVWRGYRRHGDPEEPAEATVETAQMLVQSAALLVHWFLSGHVRRVT